MKFVPNERTGYLQRALRVLAHGQIRGAGLEVAELVHVNLEERRSDDVLAFLPFAKKIKIPFLQLFSMQK